MYCLVKLDSFATPWTVAHQAPLSLGFPRQEYWSVLTFPSLGNLPDPGIEPTSPTLAGGFFTTEPPGKPGEVCIYAYIYTYIVLVVKNPPHNAGKHKRPGFDPGSGKSPGEGNGTQFQFSFLKNPMDKEAWRAAVHRVAESDMIEGT